LKEVSSVPLQQSLRNLDTAYKNYFDFLKGKKKGEKISSPKFKKRTNSQSATFVKSAFSITDESLCLAKIGDLKPVRSRELPSDFGQFDA